MGYISLYSEGIDQDLYDLFKKYKKFHNEVFVIMGDSNKVWYNHKKNEKEPQGVYSEAIPKAFDSLFKENNKVYWDEVYKFYPHVFL